MYARIIWHFGFFFFLSKIWHYTRWHRWISHAGDRLSLLLSRLTEPDYLDCAQLSRLYGCDNKNYYAYYTGLHYRWSFIRHARGTSTAYGQIGRDAEVQALPWREKRQRNWLYMYKHWRHTHGQRKPQAYERSYWYALIYLQGMKYEQIDGA